MPVLSEPHGGNARLLDSTTLRYISLAAILFVLLGVFISRRSKASQPPLMSNSTPEKIVSHPDLESHSALLAKPRIQRPPQPPPFTPPVLEQPEMNLSLFEPFEPAMGNPPRRRSYTKTMSGGIEVTGEIIVAEGWRRHTRVYGGGVCKACEESDRRMSA